jgi:hypothetical protein
MLYRLVSQLKENVAKSTTVLNLKNVRMTKMGGFETEKELIAIFARKT